MKTMPVPTDSQAAAFQTTASAKNAEARFVTRNLHRVWQLRRMQATLLRPFRKVLRPLLIWLRQEHFHVASGQQGVPPAGLQLKAASWKTFMLGLVLAPLAFIMLLPLLILIFPVVVLIGLIAVAIGAMQTDEEDVEHHTLAWHAMN